MARPGISVTLLDVAPSRPAPTDTGVAFAVGVTAVGAAGDPPKVVTSLARYVDQYGDRSTGNEALYDFAECFFAEGGSKLYVAVLPATPDDSDVADALALFVPDFGPGQVAAPALTTSDIHGELLDHAAATNRRAILDLASTTTVADLATAGTGLQGQTNSRYGAAWGNWVTIPGLTASTTRTVAPSGTICGLIARSDRSKSPNQPAAGVHQIPTHVLEIENEFEDADIETLNAAGVNVFKSVFGQVQNYGFRSSADPDTLAAWYQFSNSRLVMAVVAKCQAVATRYVFAEIDGQRKKLAQFQGDLVGEAFLPFYNSGSLYGESPGEAFSVDAISVEANPDSQLAEGTVRALCAIRPSPFAETISIELINSPITSALSA